MDEDQGASRSPKHGGPAMAAPILRFDLPAELEQLRQQPAYQNGDPSGRTLVKEPDLRIMLMALKAGARLPEHHASGPISIQAIEGRLRVRFAGQPSEITAGQLLAAEASIPHDVEAVEDSAFVLTIGRTTYADVSDQHEPGA
ncbi:MAG: cupin domain-containing protein [Chloroflexota bacterium]|nr:cupin domain-containing protein [Chloroflexota bacterium]